MSNALSKYPPHCPSSLWRWQPSFVYESITDTLNCSVWRSQVQSLNFSLMDGHWSEPSKIVSAGEKASFSPVQSFSGCSLYNPKANSTVCNMPETFGKKKKQLTLVVLILLPVAHIHPELSGSVLHSSPSRQGSISHHHFPITMEAVQRQETGLFAIHPIWAWDCVLL